MLALWKDMVGCVVGIAEEYYLLVENVDFLCGLCDLCTNESDKADLDASVPDTRGGVERKVA